MNSTKYIEQVTCPQNYAKAGCALIFKALGNTSCTPDKPLSNFGIWSVQTSTRTNTLQEAMVGSETITEKQGLQTQDVYDFEETEYKRDGLIADDKQMGNGAYTTPCLQGHRSDVDVNEYSDDTDEYAEAEDQLDQNLDDVLAKSPVLAYGEGTMPKRRKVKRAGQATVASVNKTTDPSLQDDFHEVVDDGVNTGHASSFVSVKITTDANIQEMGRLLKEGIKSVATVSGDCSIVDVKELNNSSNTEDRENTLATVEDHQSPSDSKEYRNLFEKLGGCRCETTTIISKPQPNDTLPKKDKGKPKYRAKQRGRGRPRLSYRKRRFVTKLQDNKREKLKNKIKQKITVARVNSLKKKRNTKVELTDFERALCSPDIALKVRKPKHNSKTITPSKICSVPLPTAELIKDTATCKSDVYIDVAETPETNYLTSGCPTPTVDRLSGFSTIEDFEFLKDPANNVQIGLKQKEKLNNSSFPDGYLTLSINTADVKVYSFDLNHFSSDLFRVPVKEELVGTPLSRKRKVATGKEGIRNKLPRKRILQFEQSKAQEKTTATTAQKSTVSSEKNQTEVDQSNVVIKPIVPRTTLTHVEQSKAQEKIPAVSSQESNNAEGKEPNVLNLNEIIQDIETNTIVTQSKETDRTAAIGAHDSSVSMVEENNILCSNEGVTINVQKEIITQETDQITSVSVEKPTVPVEEPLLSENEFDYKEGLIDGELSDDNWELDDYELKQPAGEVIGIPESNISMNRLSPSSVEECTDFSESDKQYTKQLRLRQDSSNLSLSSEGVNGSVEQLHSVITLPNDGPLPSVQSGIEQFQNNNNTIVNDSKAQDSNKMPLSMHVETYPDISTFTDQPKLLQTSIADLSTSVKIAVQSPSVETQSPNITSGTPYSLNELKLGSNPISLISESVSSRTKTSGMALKPVTVGSTLSNGIITNSGFSDNNTYCQTLRSAPNVSNVTAPLTVMTSVSDSNLPAPLMTLAEIASNELTTTAMETEKPNEIHRQALAKILPSPIVSPVARKEQNHSDSLTDNPNSAIIGALTNTNSHKFSLDENGKVSHQVSKDKRPKNVSEDVVAESKRKRKYAFAQKFVHEMSSHQTKESPGEANNCVHKKTKPDGGKHPLSSESSIIHQTEHTKLHVHNTQEDISRNISAISTQSKTKQTKPYSVDSKPPFIPTVAPLLSPQNQLLMQQVEMLKSSRQFPPQVMPFPPMSSHQAYLNRLPAFSRRQAPNHADYSGIYSIPPVSVSQRSPPCYSQLHVPVSADVSISDNSSGTNGLNYYTSNYSKTNNLGNHLHITSNSEQCKGIVPFRSDDNITYNSKPKAVENVSPSPVVPISKSKVLPKVSAQNIKIYQKQHADMQNDSSSRIDLSRSQDASTFKTPCNQMKEQESHLNTNGLQAVTTQVPIPNRGKMIDIRSQLRGHKLYFQDELLMPDVSSKEIGITSGLDLLSTAANLPNILNDVDLSNETKQENSFPAKSDSPRSTPTESSEHEVITNVKQTPNESFTLPNTPPESVNDHDDLSDSKSRTATKRKDHLDFAQFSKAELYNELLRRQSLTKCICGCSFLDSTMFMLHRASHNTDQPHMCAYCGKVGRSWMDFYAHMCDHSK